MDPKHRDRLAFVKIVSGTFERNIRIFMFGKIKKLNFRHPTLFAEKKKLLMFLSQVI